MRSETFPMPLSIKVMSLMLFTLSLELFFCLILYLSIVLELSEVKKISTTMALLNPRSNIVNIPSICLWSTCRLGSLILNCAKFTIMTPSLLLTMCHPHHSKLGPIIHRVQTKSRAHSKPCPISFRNATVTQMNLNPNARMMQKQQSPRTSARPRFAVSKVMRMNLNSL